MSKHSYTPIEYKNAPDHKTTPLNAANLNHMEEGITNAFTDISETQEIIAPVEDTLTASQAYAVGDQFIYQNVLYKATAAISAGGSISINGNCSAADTIVEQLASAGDKGSVSVTANGVKTYAQLFADLYSLLDRAKLTAFSTFSLNGSSFYAHRSSSSIDVTFSGCHATPTGLGVDRLHIGNSTSNSHFYASSVSGSNPAVLTNQALDSSVPNNGTKFTIYY